MPTDKRDFSKEAQTWDDNPVRRQLGETMGKIIAAALAPRPGARVLDYGAGTGLVSLALAQDAGQVLAADSADGMLDVLRGKLKASGIANIEPLMLDLEAPGAVPPKVDAIASSMTLHHVADIPRLARIFHGMLAPGGRIALADLATEAGDFHADNTGVRHFGFAPDWLRDTFTAAGFTQVHVTPAHTLRKPLPTGQLREYTILLLTAVKP